MNTEHNTSSSSLSRETRERWAQRCNSRGGVVKGGPMTQVVNALPLQTEYE